VPLTAPLTAVAVKSGASTPLTFSEKLILKVTDVAVVVVVKGN
jgi:hypothetical protein